MAITHEEARNWLDGMSYAAKVQMVQDFYLLRQHLCSQVMAVPTGADDWIVRAIKKAEHLRECERQLTRLVRTVEEACADARWQAKEVTCSNCMGNGTVQGSSCVICHGTGARAI